MNITEALLASGLGMGIVFLVLVSIMAMIAIFSKVLGTARKPALAAAGAAPAPAAAPVQAAPAAAPVQAAPVQAAAAPAAAAPAAEEPHIPTVGVSLPCKLVNCDEQTAAMLMAIVADELGEKLDGLWFKSIKQVY